MKLNLEFNLQVLIEDVYLDLGRPEDVEYRAYILIGETKVEFTPDMYEETFDEIFTKLYEEEEKKIHENMMEKKFDEMYKKFIG